MPIQCPLCEKDDLIQKVSSVVAQGTTSGWVGAGSMTSMTEIARTLAPPKEPRPKDYINYMVGIVLISLGVMIVSGFGIMGLTLLGDLDLGSLGYGIYCLWCGLPILLGSATSSILRALVDRSRRNDRMRVAREKALWRDAMAKWERLYYCARDDIVFDPSDRTWAPVDEIMTYLYAEEE